MWTTIKPYIIKYGTGIFVAGVSAAIAALPALVADGNLSKADLTAMGLAALVGIRLWLSSQGAHLGQILGVSAPPSRREDDPK